MSDTPRRPGIITFLAILHFIGAAGWLLGAGGSLFGLAGVDNSASTIVVGASALVCALACGLQFACAIGLWTLRPYGRLLQIVFAIIFILGFPFGTAVSILLLIYLSKPGVKLLFSGRPVVDMTPQEQAALAADGGTPGVAVAIIVLIGVMSVGSVVFIPMVAAIAIPGMLRARMTANEISARSTIEATETAEAAFAATCGNGGYAASFLVLGEPPAPGSQAFVGPDLGANAAPQKHGYNFTLRPAALSTAGPLDCHGNATVSAWYATATPQTHGSTGLKSFAANSVDGLWEADSPNAPAEPFGPPAVRVR